MIESLILIFAIFVFGIRQQIVVKEIEIPVKEIQAPQNQLKRPKVIVRVDADGWVSATGLGKELPRFDSKGEEAMAPFDKWLEGLKQNHPQEEPSFEIEGAEKVKMQTILDVLNSLTIAQFGRVSFSTKK